MSRQWDLQRYILDAAWASNVPQIFSSHKFRRLQARFRADAGCALPGIDYVYAIAPLQNGGTPKSDK
jgi:hypothetical protein